MRQRHLSIILLAVLALIIGAATAQAASTLVASPNSIALSCDTVLGISAPVTVNLTLATAGAAETVVVTSSSTALVLPASASVTSTSATSATPFVISMRPGCKNATVGTSTVTVTFTPTPGTLLTINAVLTVTNSGTALAPSPSAVTITCTKSGGVYTPGSAQTVNVYSAANGGTPFTVENTTYPLPSWLQITPMTPGSAASATPVALSVVAKAGCGGLAVGSTTFLAHLSNAPATDKVLPVTIQVGSGSTLASSPTSVALSYVKGSSVFTAATANVSATPAVFFTVDVSSLPLWLNVTPVSGTTAAPVAVSFVPTAGAETLALGTYSATVRLKVSGALDFTIPVTLQVKNPAAALTTTEGISRTINWTLGTALPTLTITPISSDVPIAYTVSTTAGTLSPQVSLPQNKGLAYNFGSPFTVTFLQSVFSGAAPGAELVGHVILTPAAGAAVDVTITVHVRSPAASIASLSPASLPTATTGSFTVVITGAGFVPSADPLLKTRVGVVNAGLIVNDANIAANVVNTSTIILSITVPASADPYLPFSGNGGNVALGLCNPQGTSCSAPTGTATLVIGVNPIVQAITSASSYLQATPPALTAIAPYDLLSVFGTNFCVSAGTGCTGSNPVLYGAADTLTLKYPAALSPDAAGATQRNLVVTFQTHASSPTVIATSPLLFATNNQINALVPEAVKNYIGSTVDVVVSFGYGTGATLLKSSPYSLTVTATNPGVFAVGGAGQGDAAALNSGYSLITQTTPGGLRNPATDSDVIMLYVTGLGVPDADLTAPGWTGVTCMAVSDYWGAVNTNTGVSPALTTADGLVVQSALFTSGATAPCVKSASSLVPTVTVGGVAATVLYAGWVPDSVAGLYQINVRLPSSAASYTNEAGAVTLTAAAVQLPIVVQANSKSSQVSGVNLWVIPRLKLVASGATTGTVGAAWGGSTLTATEGDGTYGFTVSAGTLPDGLALQADGTIDGQPTTAGSSIVEFTATDGHGWTGTVTVTFVIAAS
jgi:uncharacterized protein (TIGR03437 family)